MCAIELRKYRSTSSLTPSMLAVIYQDGAGGDTFNIECLESTFAGGR